jgi:predicted PurR-regulated permease PerM
MRKPARAGKPAAPKPPVAKAEPRALPPERAVAEGVPAIVLAPREPASAVFGRRARMWLLGLAIFLLLLWLLSNVLMPFVLAIIIAYLFDPVCNKLERLGVPRWLGTTIVLLGFVLILVIGMLILVPIIVRQIDGLIAAMPNYVDRLSAFVQPIIDRLREHLSERDFAELQSAARNYAGTVVSWAGTLLGGIWQGGMAIIDVLSLVVVTPVVAFYLLRDWWLMVDTIDRNVPLPERPTVHLLAGRVDRTLARFMRGQLTVCLLLGSFYAITLTLVGLDFALLIGLFTGILSLIPYVGTAVGFFASVGVAIFQFDDWVMWAIVAGIFIVGQFLEGNFIAPKLVGESVGLHPVWVMFALLAGGALFGFTGVMLAVPIAAILGVLIRYAMERYRASALYQGEPPPDRAAV